MNKDKALKFAKEYIKEAFNPTFNFDLNKDLNVVFNQEILEDDPNLEILKSELNKVGFNISKTENSKTWTISKIN